MSQVNEMSAVQKDETVAVLALNPAVDISYEVAQLMADQKVRALNTYYHPGGNGINVARALVELGIGVHCCTVVGGQGGELFLRLLGDALGDGHEIFEVEGETRINVTLQQTQPPTQYEVDGGGPAITEELLGRIKSSFLQHAGNGFGVLTGSIPPGVPESTYAELIEEISAHGGKAVLDAHGGVLDHAIAANPYLLRTNQYILECFLRRRLDSIEAVANAAREVQNSGTEYVCITLGRQGAVLANSQNSFHCTAPRVRVLSTVGSGDALLAGIIAACQQGKSAEEMLRFGVTCGTAMSSHAGTELFTRAEIDNADFDMDLRVLDI